MLRHGDHHLLGGEGLVVAVFTGEPVGGHCSFTLDTLQAQTDKNVSVSGGHNSMPLLL